MSDATETSNNYPLGSFWPSAGRPSHLVSEFGIELISCLCFAWNIYADEIELIFVTLFGGLRKKYGTPSSYVGITAADYLMVILDT